MRRFATTVALAAACMLVLSSSALAHQSRPVGPFNTVVGWLEEPAYAGFRNAIQFTIDRPAAGAEDDHDNGSASPVTNAELQVVVIFGDRDGTERTEPMDLRPAFGRPGEYRAFLIPTRAGTYTFHITGTVGNREIDEYYTSGEAGEVEGSTGTYNDVVSPAEVQFPAQDPAPADLQAETQRVLTVAAAADDSAGTAQTLAIVALVLAAAAIVLVVVRGAPRRKERASA